jgi:hypothetical protein
MDPLSANFEWHGRTQYATMAEYMKANFVMIAINYVLNNELNCSRTPRLRSQDLFAALQTQPEYQALSLDELQDLLFEVFTSGDFGRLGWEVKITDYRAADPARRDYCPCCDHKPRGPPNFEVELAAKDEEEEKEEEKG